MINPIVASGLPCITRETSRSSYLEASDAESASVHLSPNIRFCVLGYQTLPTVSGFELARRILAHIASARIIMFSMNDDPIFAVRAIEIGGQGLCLQVPRFRTTSLRPSAKSAKAEHTCRRNRPKHRVRRPFVDPNPLSKLTSPRSRYYVCSAPAKSLSEIAWLVHSSYQTIANTSSIMRQKLGVRTSAELVRLAIESSLTLIPAGNRAIQLPIFTGAGWPTEHQTAVFRSDNHNTDP